MGAVIYWHPEPPTSDLAAAACLFGTLALALMMNSPVRYLSFKGFATRRPQHHRTLVVVAGLIVAALAEPVLVFLFLAGGYALHPLFGALARLLRRRTAGSPDPAAEESRTANRGIPRTNH